MKRILALLLMTTAALAVAATPLAAEQLKIDTGLISGEVLDESSNLTVYRGIPFAAPPVGLAASASS